MEKLRDNQRFRRIAVGRQIRLMYIGLLQETRI